MPEYLYRCPNCGRTDYISHGMREKLELLCVICDTPMVKKPIALMVNWGGLKPSQGELHPNIKKVIDDAPRRRDEEAK